ncbi:MAG: hypothetical protein ACREQW_00085 [Candidatus Binatia bacterium]
MPHSLGGLRSRLLSGAEVRRALHSLPAALRDLLGGAAITAYYGWGCNLHADLQYVPMRVAVASLERFIADSLAQEIVIPGGSDFCFIVAEDRLEILFCHEGDIHLKGRDHSLLEALQKTGFLSEIEFKSSIGSWA